MKYLVHTLSSLMSLMLGAVTGISGFVAVQALLISIDHRYQLHFNGAWVTIILVGMVATIYFKKKVFVVPTLPKE